MARQITRNQWIERFGATHGIGKHRPETRMAGDALAEPAAPAFTRLREPTLESYTAVAIADDGLLVPLGHFPTEDEAWIALHARKPGFYVPNYQTLDVMPSPAALAAEQESIRHVLQREDERVMAELGGDMDTRWDDPYHVF